jgi:hypothetical protein
MGCTEEKRAICKAEGKVCNPRTGRCKVAEADKKASKKASTGKGKKAAVPSSSLAVGALMAQMGTQTNISMLEKGRSDKLGAGMDTMVEMVKAKVVKSGKKSGGKKKSGSKKSGGKKKSGSKKSGSKGGSKGSKCGAPCALSKTGMIRVRTTSPPCRCLVPNGRAARAEGICPAGKVAVTGVYKSGSRAGLQYTRCIKQGGSTAKRMLGQEGCPPGKVLKEYVSASGMVTARRCVKASARSGQKNCPANQVIVEVRQSGRTPVLKSTRKSYNYDRMVLRCVLPKTAAMKGYRVVGQGTLPVKPRLYTY